MNADGRRRFEGKVVVVTGGASDFGQVEVLVNNTGIARRSQETQDRMLEQVQAAITGQVVSPNGGLHSY